jgi:hypothetical protein
MAKDGKQLLRGSQQVDARKKAFTVSKSLNPTCLPFESFSICPLTLHAWLLAE